MASFQIKGLREMDKALQELKRPTAKSVARRVLKEAGEPIARSARAKVPKLTLHMAESIDVGTKLTRRQASLAKKFSKSGVEVYIGPNDPGAVAEEFGWEHGAAQPFMRPAWDANKGLALTIIVNRMWDEINKAADRARRKALKLKG